MFTSLLVAAAPAQALPSTKYQPETLFGGYKDRVVEPGLWRIDARANGMAELGLAQNMAAYRAADIVREAGYEYMQIVNQKGESWSINGMRAGGKMTLWVKGAHDSAQPEDCRAKRPELCVTVPVARTLERTRPLLRFPTDTPRQRIPDRVGG